MPSILPDANRSPASVSAPALPRNRRARPAVSAGPRSKARKPLRDSPLLISLGILLLLGVLIGTLTLANRSATFFTPDFLSEFVLYALSMADLTMVVALFFVLARNLIKLLVERRRALPFAKFRSKLVAALLGMTLIPSVLVLLVGGEIIRTSVERWFNAPMDEILASANQLASDYYHERQQLAQDHARRIAGTLSALDLASVDLRRIQDLVDPEVKAQRVGLVEIYRVVPTANGRAEVVSLLEVAASTLPRDASDRASADRLAAHAVQGPADPILEPIGRGGELIRVASPIRGATGRITGVVVASDYLTGDVATRPRRMTDAYEAYMQLRVLKGPLTGVYLSFFLMLTLMILVGATWMGLYIAKRITKPIQTLAAAAREIGAGHLDHRVERETTDEFGGLVDAFNTMAGELSVSRRRLERSAIDVQRKHQEVETRRRYIETILQRIATGVISIDAHDRVGTVNGAAGRLLGLDESAVGKPATEVFGRADLEPLQKLLNGDGHLKGEPLAEEIALTQDGRELHLAAMVTTLHGEDGRPEGRVLVFDDITPLIRSQKVAAWREVARRLAHEIKNPLTPIQLSAERLKRHFGGAPDATRALVDECTSTIVGEVESLKGLVDEFSQFARMPAPRRAAVDVRELLRESLALYNGLFQQITLVSTFDPELPPVRIDPEQIRRVLINLVDNAVEAMNRKGTIWIETAHDAAHGLARIIVADDGPGIPAADRDKLFMPYYSTKRRGSGLGLAIVRRIVSEHGGTIEVADNVPHGTRFTIELPL
ncbi:MAG: HAMP domain-containing protein [Acidobacteria bacterium]|nr:HAMP domain-containing protein [Acidobacteriota bacterium]